MSFLGGIFGSRNREIPEDEQPFISDQERDESDAFAQAALHDLQEDAAASHVTLSGRVHRESGDRANAIAQQRLGISPSSTSSRAADYLPRETPNDDHETLLSPGSPRSEDSMMSVNSRRERFNREGGLEFLRSINPVVALRTRNIILQFFNWIGDLVAKLRGKSDERFKNQVMEFARKDVAMCALLNLHDAPALKKTVLDILKEGAHPLTRELASIRAELKEGNLDPARENELTARKGQIKGSLQSIADAFCDAVRLVANEVRYTKTRRNMEVFDNDAAKQIRTLVELERFIIQAQAFEEVDLQVLFDPSLQSQETAEFQKTKRNVLEYLTNADLSIEEKVQFLKDYSLLDIESARFLLETVSFSSFEQEAKNVTAFENAGVSIPLSILRARSEKLTQMLASREDGTVLSTENCSLTDINPILSSQNLERFNREDPFLRSLLQTWARINPTLKQLIAEKGENISIADILADRSQVDQMDATKRAEHTQLRYKIAVQVALYMGSRNQLAQLQIFIGSFPYLGGTHENPKPLFDATDTPLFELFDQDLEAMLTSIDKPLDGQSLNDYVGIEKGKLEALNRNLKEATGKFWSSSEGGRSKSEVEAFKEPFLGPIRQQSAKVILMHYAHFLNNLPK